MKKKRSFISIFQGGYRKNRKNQRLLAFYWRGRGGQGTGLIRWGQMYIYIYISSLLFLLES